MPSNQTIPLTTPRRDWLALAVLAAFPALIVMLILASAWRTTPASAQQPIIILGTTTPTTAPTAVPSGGLARAIVAYAAPGGAVLGSIEPGRVYHVVARSGADWLQLDVDSSGLVWTTAASVDGVDMAILPDLAPLPTQAPVAHDPPAPQIIERTVYIEQPAPESRTITYIPATPILPDVPRAGPPQTEEEAQSSPETSGGPEPIAPTPEPEDEPPLQDGVHVSSPYFSCVLGPAGDACRANTVALPVPGEDQ